MRNKNLVYNSTYNNEDLLRENLRGRGVLLILLLGLLVILWRLGGFWQGGDGQEQVQPAQTPTARGYSLSADRAGIAHWREYREEMARQAAKIRVAIYSTHSSESYTAYSGEPKVYGERGGVYRASEVLAEVLEGVGIGALVDDTIHDSPDWNMSYANSLATAEELLAAYPNLSILIDMHRDAGVSRKNSFVSINGRQAAKIMLVCGSDQRYDHANWQQNQAFMEKIADKMDNMYPGLLRRVSVQSGRYNQHIFNRAILVEMGTTENTIEEVEYSAEMLANVLAAVLEEEGAV